MILVDTNVLSEALRPAPDRAVVDWLQAGRGKLWLPSFVIAELRYGSERLPPSRKRQQLEEFRAEILKQYRYRIVDFDAVAAEAHGILQAVLKRKGKPVAAPDSYIAAIALSRNAAVATRNRKHYQHTGVRLIDPWPK